MQRKPFLKRFRLILPIGVAILLISSPTGAQSLYTAVSVEPSYIEADAVLSLKGDDACVGIDLPFTFPFYKKGYDSAYVSTNGYLSFSAEGCSNSANTSLPNTRVPNGAIYAFWDDLYVDPPKGSVFTKLLGTAPNKQFVIEWRNVLILGASRMDFEIVLNENGVILLQYRNIATERQMGSLATVGIEDETATSAVQVLYNLASIGAGTYAIRFANGPKSVPVDIKPRACPNHFDVDSYGVLHVAILGTSDLDVTTIDPNTITMGGVAVISKEQNPLLTKKRMKLVASKLRHRGWYLRDVGTPCEPFDGKTDPQQCNNLGPDGNLDLVLNFDAQQIADSLGDDVEDKEPITLQLHGKLLDGTEIKGEDVVIIKKEKHHGWDRGHHKGWDHDRGNHKDCDHDKGLDKGHR